MNKINSKDKNARNFSMFFNRLIAILLASVFLLPITSVNAAAPTSGSVNPTVGSSVNWNGTALGGASPDGEATCVEGTNCDTFSLT